MSLPQAKRFDPGKASGETAGPLPPLCPISAREGHTHPPRGDSDMKNPLPSGIHW